MSVAQQANSRQNWDKLWSSEGEDSWRKAAVSPVYDRILQLLPRHSTVIDIGGGRGFFAERLRDEKACSVEVWEHNDAALQACLDKDIYAVGVDLYELTEKEPTVGKAFMMGALLLRGTVVATEVLEHLEDNVLHELLTRIAQRERPCYFSVPNDRLGPDEEPQHVRKWTALEFKNHLKKYFKHVRVEVLGPRVQPSEPFPSDRGQRAFLLAICNVPKRANLSVCFPARDEAADIEETLASFMGVADEMVIGIDPRTTDGTRALAEKYANVVFDLVELLGPPGEEVANPNGFHFSHARNQCMRKCTEPWIFMTEAHESLWHGADELLHLDTLPHYVQVVQVLRTGGRPPNRQQWLFPWLTRNRKDIFYKRSTHNTLEYGDLPAVILPQVKTLHERVHSKDLERQAQRKVQNRAELTADWLENQNDWSLHYLGAEWREWDTVRAIKYLYDYLKVGKNGALRYHTRLVLAKELIRLQRKREAREVLAPATGDDWTRSEHWVFLGDLAFNDEAYEEAVIYYQYAATRIEKPPLTTWWVDLAMYSWIPAQRLAMAYSALCDFPKALHWATICRDEYTKADAPEPMVAEAEENIRILKEALNEGDESGHRAA